MSLMDFLKKFSILIFAILALLLSRMGISYLILLVLIGLILSFINQRKRDAVISGILYALISYIISYPSGLFLKDYMPNTSVIVQTDINVVIFHLIIGALIPIVVAIIICGITAIIGSNISRYINSNKNIKKESTKHNFKLIENFKQSNQNSRKEQQHKEDLINLTPIQKAKIKKQNKKGD